MRQTQENLLTAYRNFATIIKSLNKKGSRRHHPSEPRKPIACTSGAQGAVSSLYCHAHHPFAMATWRKYLGEQSRFAPPLCGERSSTVERPHRDRMVGGSIPLARPNSLRWWFLLAFCPAGQDRFSCTLAALLWRHGSGPSRTAYLSATTPKGHSIRIFSFGCHS